MADIDLGFLCHDSKKSGDGQFAPPRVYLLFRTTHKASPAGPCRKQKPFSSSSGFFCRQLSQFPLQSAHQFVQTGHSQLIKLKQLEHPFGRSPTGIELQEHCRNQGQIKLIGRSLLAFGQPMPAAQQAFYPPEKQFDLPPPPIQQDHQCRWQFVGSQVGQQNHLTVPHLLQPQHSDPGAVGSPGGPKMCPGLLHNSGLAVLLAHRQLLLHRDHRWFPQPHHVAATQFLQLAQYTVILCKVPIANVRLAPLPLLLPNRSLATSAIGHMGSYGFAAQDLIVQVQPCGLVSARAPSAIQRPSHPRQRGKERTIARHPIVSAQAWIAIALTRQFGGHRLEYLGQQLRRNQMLSFREASQAHVATTDLPTHALQVAGRAQSSHRPNHWIEQPKQKQTQIIGHQQQALRILKRRMQREFLLRLRQATLKLVQQFPVRQVGFSHRLVSTERGALWLSLGHAASEPEYAQKYKLRTCYSYLTKGSQGSLATTMPNTID